MEKVVKLSEIITNTDFNIFYKNFNDDKIKGNDVFDKYRYIKPSFSDNGEDRVIEYIFSLIGSTDKYFVEFGARDGISGSNTYFLEKYKEWNGLLLEGDNKFIENSRKTPIYNEFLTSKNINDIFIKYNIPKTFDLLSIDIDSTDYYIWESLTFRPRIVIIETNPGIPNNIPLVIKENNYGKNGDSNSEAYFGANLHAIYLLAKKKGYELVTTVRWNAIFIVKEEFNKLNINPISKEECINLFFKPNRWWFNKVLNEIKNNNSEWILKEDI